ncbi:MAG TPA: prepilin peptidase [Fimbriimonas sp.]
MLPDWTWVIGLFLGATIGSFLNVVIYRLPRGISLSNPPNSFCPKCRHSLGPLDLFPLLSWLASGGKCRYCREKVPSRYFWVELLNGTLWAILWYQFMVVQWLPLTAAAYMLVTAALVAVIFIDWELYIIPDELNAVILLFGLGYHGLNGSIETSLKGALVGWGVIWGIQLMGTLLFRKAAMGDGDIKMMRGVGAVLGPLLTAASVGMAVVLGLVGGIVGIVVASALAKRQPQEAEEAPEGDPEPVYLRDQLVTGVYYLLCLDVLALFYRPIEEAVVKMLIAQPQSEDVEEDDWKPSMTTIPFGPYLAAGAILCMLFGGWVEKGLKAYWENATGADRAVQRNTGVARPPAEGVTLLHVSTNRKISGEPRNIVGASPVSLAGESRADYA